MKICILARVLQPLQLSSILCKCLGILWGWVSYCEVLTAVNYISVGESSRKRNALSETSLLTSVELIQRLHRKDTTQQSPDIVHGIDLPLKRYTHCPLRDLDRDLCQRWENDRGHYQEAVVSCQDSHHCQLISGEEKTTLLIFWENWGCLSSPKNTLPESRDCGR